MDPCSLAFDFLRQQKLLAIGTSLDSKQWIANVYLAADEKDRLFFVSGLEAEHSKHIIENPHVTFAAAWHNPKNHRERKGIQGIGRCRLCTDAEEVRAGVAAHNKLYPEFAQRLTFDYLKSNTNGSYVWIIKPTRIKYWDDKAFGQDESREITF